MSAKPATSVHLWYTMPQFNAGEVKSAEFHNEVKVEQSAKCTYFSVIQFYNGGYCGIQQRECDKIAIFSLWNDDQGKHNAELVSKHQRAIVEPFGGEGTGLKCICPFPWELNEVVGFTVSAKYSENKWFVKCMAERQGEQIEMATYSRRGENPMKGMCCFVEDWDRRPEAEGLLHLRKAWFGNAYGEIDGKRTDLRHVRYNRVEDGLDLCGNDRCTASRDGSWFCLQTGGPEPLELCCQKGTEFSC